MMSAILEMVRNNWALILAMILGLVLGWSAHAQFTTPDNIIAPCICADEL